MDSHDADLADIKGALIRIEARLTELEKDLSETNNTFDNYTHLFQFIPVRNVAYGLVGALGLLATGALATLLAIG